MNSEFKDERSMVEIIFGSKEKYLAYLREEKARMAMQNQLYTARKEGRAEGIAEGREEERQKHKVKMARMVSTMMEKGLSLEEIVDMTGFSREEVEEAVRTATEAADAITEEKC